MPGTILYENKTPGGVTIRVVQGDITQERVDAIVNAANSHLAHGGGVAGAISRAGGPVIQKESAEWVAIHGPVPTGGGAITGAGRLPCRNVIHVVGPVWRNQGDEDQLLASAVASAIRIAGEHNLKTIALPAISTGIFGFPKERGARVIVQAVLDSVINTNITGVNLTNIDAGTSAIMERVAREILE
ncbi:MAG: macro domain-containing protein [Anaerolineales bacterium]|nr:macro domain-containing protein [Anaerolineales bacterium]